MASKTIIYEQPLHEHIHVCLRLDHLFHQLKHYLHDTSVAGSRIALATLLDIANVADRPDLRGKLSRLLSQYANTLAPLERVQNVNSQRLREILIKLDRFTDALHLSHGRFGQILRENEFLNTIRLHLAKPGGICDFNFPAYHLWLQQPPETRQQAIGDWFKEFDQLRAIVNLILQLLRDSCQLQPKLATHGFYQEALSVTIPYQMIRVALPVELNIYPEISVGRHRLSIHFFMPNFTTGRPTQINNDVEFSLSCCAS